jgi:hypothetical protein
LFFSQPSLSRLPPQLSFVSQPFPVLQLSSILQLFFILQFLSIFTHYTYHVPVLADKKKVNRPRNSLGRFASTSTTLHPALFTPSTSSPSSTVSSLPASSSDSSTLSSDWDYQHTNTTPATSPPPALPQPIQTTTTMTKSRSLQWDGGPDEKMAPGQFHQEINIKIEDRNYTTDAKKIDCF